MNIQELKELIKDLPDEMEIIMQKDSEGNGYSPLEGIDKAVVYVPDSTWSGTVYSTNWTADEACMGEEEWEEFKKKPRVIVLYP